MDASDKLQDDIFEYQRTLLLKSIDIGDNIIKGFDEQSFKTKSWCILIWVGFIGWAFGKNVAIMFYIALFIPILFWIFNTSIKQLQRGYIITANFVRKKLSNPDYIKEMFEKKSLLELPAYDMNGHYTLRVNKKHSDWYKKRTSFIGSLFLRNIALFYCIIIGINILIIIFR